MTTSSGIINANFFLKLIDNTNEIMENLRIIKATVPNETAKNIETQITCLNEHIVEFRLAIVELRKGR